MKRKGRVLSFLVCSESDDLKDEMKAKEKRQTKGAQPRLGLYFSTTTYKKTREGKAQHKEETRHKRTQHTGQEKVVKDCAGLVVKKEFF